MQKEETDTSITANSAAERAANYYDQGDSCIRAVLRAITNSENPELLAATSGFSCGIGKSGCLCGAVTGAVMALGIKGKGRRSAELVATFKDIFQTTCCRSLSKNYTWMSKQHQANCRRITAETTRLVATMLNQESESA